MNKSKKVFLITSCISIIGISLSYGEQNNFLGKDQVVKTLKSEVLNEGLSKKVSLDLRGMDILDTLKFLATQGSLNIVATKNVSGRVTLFLKDVTIEDILDIVLLTNKLACEKKKDLIVIMTEDEYEALYGKKYSDKKGIKTIKLKYADVEKVKAVLDNLKSLIGKIAADKDTGTVIIIDTYEKIDQMEEVIKKMDLATVNRVIPTVTEKFELEYANAVEIKDKISEMLTKDVGSVVVDERTNQLIVTDLVHNMEKIKSLVQTFDSKTRQVFIEAKILEVSLNDEFSMGVEWSKIFRDSDNLTITGELPFSSPASTSSSFKADAGTFTSDNYEAALELIKSVGNTKILASPHIAVCNKDEATFMVGSREAYVTTTTTTGEVTETKSEIVNFVDVGVTLYVTPVINKDGFIQMHIKPEVSSVREWLETSEGNKVPIVDTSNVETNVLIKDGQTIIIAGLIKEETRKNLSKVPLIGGIPILGIPFKTKSDQVKRKEFVIFLTPHIITGEDMTEESKKKYEKLIEREVE